MAMSAPVSNGIPLAPEQISEAMRASELFVQVMHRTLGERTLTEAPGEAISMTQLLALRFIWLHPRVLIGDLAEGLHVSYPSVTNLVNRLEKHQFVVRTANPQDRREVEVRLTALGLQTIEELERERIRRFDQVIQSMAADQRESLLSGLAAFVVAAVGEDRYIADDICLRCGSAASSCCPIARSQTVEFCR